MPAAIPGQQASSSASTPSRGESSDRSTNPSSDSGAMKSPAAKKVVEALNTALRMFKADHMEMARDFVLNPDLRKDQAVIANPENYTNAVGATVRAAESIVADRPSHPSESAESDYVFVPATIMENHSVGAFVRHAIRTSSSATDPASRESHEQFAVGRYMRSETTGEMLLVASDIPYAGRSCICLVWLAPPVRANRACLKIVCDQNLFNSVGTAVQSVLYFEHSFRVTTTPCADCAAVAPPLVPSASAPTPSNDGAKNKCVCTRPLVLPSHALDFSHNFSNMDVHSASSAGCIKVVYPPSPGEVPSLVTDKSCHLIIKVHLDEAVMRRLRTRALSQHVNSSRRIVLPQETLNRCLIPPTVAGSSDSYLTAAALQAASPDVFTGVLNNVALTNAQQALLTGGAFPALRHAQAIDPWQQHALAARRHRGDMRPLDFSQDGGDQGVRNGNSVQQSSADMQDTLAMLLNDTGDYAVGDISWASPGIAANEVQADSGLHDDVGCHVVNDLAALSPLSRPAAGSSIVRRPLSRRRRSAVSLSASDQQLSAEMRRKLSNRASAARSNARRKARFDALKQSLEDVKRRVIELKNKHEEVAQENTALKQNLGSGDVDEVVIPQPFEDWSSLSHGLDIGLFGQLSEI